MLKWLYNIYIFVKSFFFNIDTIFSINETGDKINLYNNYQIIKICCYIFSIIKIIPFYGTTIFDKLINSLCSEYKIILIKIFNNGNIKNIIIENKKMIDIIKIINNVSFDINDMIMNKKFIITDILLKNNTNNISIKKMIDQYSDKPKLYDHTLNNIFKINNIYYDNNSQIEVKYINSLKYNSNIYVLKDVINWHVCDLYNLL